MESQPNAPSEWGVRPVSGHLDGDVVGRTLTVHLQYTTPTRLQERAFQLLGVAPCKM